MKIRLTSSILFLASLFGAVAVSNAHFAHSDDYGWNRERDRSSDFGLEEFRDHRHNPERAFKMGVCVGQALAAAGVVVPPPQPGVRPSPDPMTEAAYKTAVQQCRAEFSGTTASPVPTAAPTDAPVSAPTPTPTDTTS
jgi:hypothetical protein